MNHHHREVRIEGKRGCSEARRMNSMCCFCSTTVFLAGSVATMKGEITVGSLLVRQKKKKKKEEKNYWISDDVVTEKQEWSCVKPVPPDFYV